MLYGSFDLVIHCLKENSEQVLSTGDWLPILCRAHARSRTRWPILQGLPEHAQRDQCEKQDREAQAGEPVEAHNPIGLIREERGLHRTNQDR